MKILVSGVLLLACIAVIYRVYAFSQERFFTVDEYQYAHATWLVSEGERPYVDFYEHHFPLSYVLHAPLLLVEGSFPERALRLRTAVASWWVLAMVCVGFLIRQVSGDGRAALLAVALSLSFGFSLMSGVDYRADNFGAFLLLLGCALLERNRGPGASRWRALFSGVLLGLSIGMTQKMIFLAGGSVLAWLAFDLLLARRPGRASFVAKPLAVGSGLALVMAGGLAWMATLGILDRGFEITVLQAFHHEVFYPAVSAWTYLEPFLRSTPVTTFAIVVCALAFFALSRDAFWAVPLVIAALGGILIKAQYPYNYVFPGLVLAVLAARGVGLAISRATPAMGAMRPWAPLLYLLPLALLPAQWNFVTGTTSNEHQLAILEKIERFSEPDEIVIDNSGGALFRPHASYYYHHGDAHRSMFAEYFANDLVADYRRSQALLWIMDYRLLDLPARVHHYFQTHYVRADGSLFGLGFHLGPTETTEHSMTIDVIREGDYYVFPSPVRLSAGPRKRTHPKREYDFTIDGVPVTGSQTHLDAGEHRVVIQPNAPGYFITLLSPDAFLLGEGERFERELDGARSYQLLFEYEER